MKLSASPSQAEQTFIGFTMGFEELAWLFASAAHNRGIIRQDLNEATMLWTAVRASRGPMLEIGRRHGGSTILLLLAGLDRSLLSIDLEPAHHPICDHYFQKPEIAARLTLKVGDSRIPSDMSFGFAFIDGDHTYEGVKADVIAHWNNLHDFDGFPAGAVFHDAVPNDQGVGQSSSHHDGVQKVCDELISHGCGIKRGIAGSSLWIQKTNNLPANF